MITSEFREVFAKQKFGWSLQGVISKSLLCVFSARKNRGVKRSDSMTQGALLFIKNNDCSFHCNKSISP